jgi:hypothetical protein
MFRKMGSIAAIAGSITMCSWGLGSDASAAPPDVASGQARYKPIQGMTYEFGSKLMTGYFVKQSAACVVTLMITERSDPEEPLGLSPTRIRLILWPGQVAGMDSEEGKSLNFTCEEDAAALLVDIGERDKLVALQGASLVEKTAPPE